MIISIFSLIIGLMIIAIPFMILFLMVKKVLKKEQNQPDLELRVKILEEEIKIIKSQLELLDEF